MGPASLVQVGFIGTKPGMHQLHGTASDTERSNREIALECVSQKHMSKFVAGHHVSASSLESSELESEDEFLILRRAVATEELVTSMILVPFKEIVFGERPREL